MPGDAAFLTSSTPGVKQRPSVLEVYALYGYEPSKLPEEFEDHESEKFNITPAIIEKSKKALEEFFDNENPRGANPIIKVSEDVKLRLGYIETTPVRSVLELGFYKKLEDPLTVDVNCIRDNHVNFPEGFWSINRRFITEGLRGRNIGTMLLKILEHGIEHVANKDEITQTVEIQARQVEVLNWALKNGYMPATDLDKRKIDLLYAGDTSIMITTDPSWGNGQSGRERRLGAIYSIAELQEVAKKQGLGDLTPDQIRHLDLLKLFPKEGSPYIEGAMTIILKKEIKPRT